MGESDPEAGRSAEAEQPISELDRALDDLLALQEQEHPDPAALQAVRNRLATERELMLASTVTTESAERYIQDLNQSREERDEEIIRGHAAAHIELQAAQIFGLEEDMHEMVGKVLGDMVEEYPPAIDAIITKAQASRRRGVEVIRSILELDEITNNDEVRELLSTPEKLQQFPSKQLWAVSETLMQVRNEIIDTYSAMIKATEHLKKEQAG